MEATYFPIEIKNYFLRYQIESNNEEQDLINIFANESVKEAFIGWTRAHQSVVEYTPRLYRAFDIATGSSVEWESVAKLVHSLYLWVNDDGTTTLINQFMTGKQPVIFPDNYILRTLELYESGIIDLTNLVILLSNQFGYCPLHDASVFIDAIPLLKKLDSYTLSTLLSIKNKQGGCPLLHNQGMLGIAFPLLKKLNNRELVSIFSIKEPNGNCPFLHNEYRFKTMFFLFEKIDARDQVLLLSIKDQDGNCSLHNCDIFEQARPILVKFNNKDLVTVLSIKNSDGSCPLHNYFIVAEALPILKKLDDHDLVTVFSIKDSQGNCPLHNCDIFEKALPVLKNLDNHDLVKVLSIKDSQGDCPLHNCDVFKKALPVLKKLDNHDLVKVFSLKNQNGYCTLHYTFTNALPLLENLNINDLITVLSIHDKYGSCLLARHFSTSIDLLKNLNNEELLSIFSIKNKNGDCILNYPFVFNGLLPLIKKLNFQELVTILLGKNQNGNYPVDRPEIFTTVVKLLDNFLDESSLYQFLSIKNNRESTFIPSNSSANAISQVSVPLELLNPINISPKETVFQLIAEDILKTTGFVLSSDDGKHSVRNSESFSEVQGGHAICQKIADFGIKAFRALSLDVLASKRHVNPFIYYILFIKRMAHALHLKGPFTLPNGIIREAEGFDESFTVPMLSHTFLNFLSKVENGYSPERQSWMEKVLTTATWHKNATKQRIKDIHQILQSSNQSYPIIIGSGWDWHSTQLVFTEQGKFFSCNCGADSVAEGEIVEFLIEDKTKLSREFLKKLVDRALVDKYKYKSINDIVSELSAKIVRKYRLPLQTVGNCTYVNMIGALYVILMLWQRKSESLSITEHLSPKELHDNFINYDIEAILLQFIEELKYSSNQTEKSGLEVKCIAEMKQMIKDQFKHNKPSNIKLNTRVMALFDQIITFKSEVLMRKV